MSSRRSIVFVLFSLFAGGAGCGGPGGPSDGVDDPESARRAYLGLDRSFDRAIDLGFAGFNAASSAHIPEQTDGGDISGVMIVGGKTDQGNSKNKNMDLEVSLEQDYQDLLVEGLAIVYNGGPATLDMSFKGLPNASLTGSYVGTFVMGGDLIGDVTLDIEFSGTTEAAPDGSIIRTPGTIHVTGTATSDYGVFAVDVTL